MLYNVIDLHSCYLIISYVIKTVLYIFSFTLRFTNHFLSLATSFRYLKIFLILLQYSSLILGFCWRRRDVIQVRVFTYCMSYSTQKIMYQCNKLVDHEFRTFNQSNKPSFPLKLRRIFYLLKLISKNL